MKSRWFVILSLSVVAGCALQAAESPEKTKPSAAEGKPAAAEAKPAEAKDPYPVTAVAKHHKSHPGARLYDTGVMEDNEACMVCHLDFKKEKIAAVHLDVGMTCCACHGDSDVHRSDELNVTRPDVIWGRAEIAAFCQQCHKTHKEPEKVEAFHKEWNGKRRPNNRFVMKDSTCTDCHGHHAIVKSEGDFK